MTDDKPAGVHYPACNDKCVHYLEGDESVPRSGSGVPQREPVGSLPGQGAVTDSSAEPAARLVLMPVRLLLSDWPPNSGLMPGDERFDAMLASVRLDGIREPLTINRKWVVIDGQHRLAAARYLGIESVPVRVWTGMEYIP
jgi:hypothetical protein